MVQDKITITSVQSGFEVVASATYSDNSRTDGWWECKVERPSSWNDDRTTQLDVFSELQDMIECAHEGLEREREAQETEQAPA